MVWGGLWEWQPRRLGKQRSALCDIYEMGSRSIWQSPRPSRWLFRELRDPRAAVRGGNGLLRLPRRLALLPGVDRAQPLWLATAAR
jgi:hypothetical protein